MSNMSAVAAPSKLHAASPDPLLPFEDMAWMTRGCTSQRVSERQAAARPRRVRASTIHALQGTALVCESPSVHAIEKNRCNFETLAKEKLELRQRPWH